MHRKFYFFIRGSHGGYFKYVIMPQEARPCTNFQENLLKVLSLPWKKHFLPDFMMRILWRLQKESLSCGL